MNGPAWQVGCGCIVGGGASTPYHRLDRETSGVVCVAKTETAARELRQLWESRAVEKQYKVFARARG